MRTGLAVVIAVLLVATAVMLQASPVAAACGTAWKSRKEPPPSILVLRTATGKVEKVGFKRYVAVVMASGEWPSSLPRPLLEAGALATKQYGWYYTLKGNHRASYKNRSGRCYDVRDDSRDQVYRPEKAEPTDKQKRARDALWGLSLRKRGDFFLTGYRRGSATKCGADATGFKLFARSARDCVKRLDYDSEQILREYFRPGLTFVWAPGTEPEEPPAASDDQEARSRSDDRVDGEPDAEPVTPDAAAPSEPPRSLFGGLVSSIMSFADTLQSRFAEPEGSRALPTNSPEPSPPSGNG